MPIVYMLTYRKALQPGDWYGPEPSGIRRFTWFALSVECRPDFDHTGVQCDKITVTERNGLYYADDNSDPLPVYDDFTHVIK